MKSPPSRSPNTKFVFAVSVNSYLKYSAKKSQHLISSLAVQQNSFCDLFMKMSTFDTLKTVSGVFTKPPTVRLVFCVVFFDKLFLSGIKSSVPYHKFTTGWHRSGAFQSRRPTRRTAIRRHAVLFKCPLQEYSTWHLVSAIIYAAVIIGSSFRTCPRVKQRRWRGGDRGWGCCIMGGGRIIRRDSDVLFKWKRSSFMRPS